VRLSEIYASITVSDQEVLVDNVDLTLVSQYRCHLFKDTNGHCTYANGFQGTKRIAFMHQLIMDAKNVDHKDGNGLNNRRSNLRVATSSLNQANSRKRQGSSQYKGVGWDKEHNKWRARINYQHRRTFLGCFEDETDAAKAYDDAARELFGEFARLNFPKKGEQGALI
jgi:hypothetical protein